jgi:hypothetical protein
MVEAGLSRGVENHRVNRIKLFFKLAASYHRRSIRSYKQVSGLHFVRTEARETKPGKPVPRKFVEALHGRAPLVS